jgi:hypothetical protein
MCRVFAYKLFVCLHTQLCMPNECSYVSLRVCVFVDVFVCVFAYACMHASQSVNYSVCVCVCVCARVCFILILQFSCSCRVLNIKNDSNMALAQFMNMLFNCKLA